MQQDKETHIQYRGKYLTVAEDLIDGRIFERVYRHDSVMVFPVQDKKILLIKEYLPCLQKHVWKSVAGLMDKPGKTPKQIAKEELAEEAQMQCERLEELYHHDRSHSIVVSNTYGFIAHNCTPLDTPIQNPDGDIVADTRYFSYQEFWDMMQSGELPPSEMTAAMFLVYKKLGAF